jgi:membrane associated rhomboid family serine protease
MPEKTRGVNAALVIADSRGGFLRPARLTVAGKPVKKGQGGMSSDHNASPFNTVPPVVVALAVLMFGIELLFEAGARGFIGGPEAVGWRLNAIRDYAFFGPVFSYMVDTGQFLPSEMMRFVTYPFIHVGFTHMLLVLVFLLALGKMVGEVFGTVPFLVVFFGSAIVGALVFALLTNVNTPLLGGYPAVYGLIGAFTFILWVRLGQQGAPQYRAFSLIALLLGIQLVFGLLFGGGPDWIAEVAGFAAGFLLSFVVSPGGWARVRERLRQR